MSEQRRPVHFTENHTPVITPCGAERTPKNRKVPERELDLWLTKSSECVTCKNCLRIMGLKR